MDASLEDVLFILPLSNDFWPEMKRLCLNCLCGCLGSGWRAWAEECVYQPDVST